jgi:hypothetical protein
MEIAIEYLCNNCYQDAAPTELFDGSIAYFYQSIPPIELLKI